jgi:GNAT superfamily N-acetyltransferase
MAELRAEVMRADLERLGRWDPVRVRQRFLDAFNPEHTFVIRSGHEDVGLIAVRPEGDSLWIEHFYLRPTHQGRGIGGQVLQHVMTEQGLNEQFRLDVLQGSPARGLYERNGFTLDHEDPIDVFLVKRASGAPTLRAGTPADRAAD